MAQKQYSQGSILLFILLVSFTALAQTKAVSFAGLTNGQKLNGFTTKAVYLDDADKPIGARFFHSQTGFTLDLLQIETVPQTFIYVNTWPASEKGEPHTQEHLLITKGNKGRQLNTRQGMSLAASNAFTQQTYTAYHFYTAAGPDVFFTLFVEYLDALLHPDYTDEEIRREVRNWGVTENPTDKTLRLEEKGSVYNEMNVSMNQPGRRQFMLMQDLVYGINHPLSYSAGGTPEAIRQIKPEDIKAYHAANYQLANMGAVVSLPKKVPLSEALARMDKIFNRLDPKPVKRTFNREENMPAPMPAETGKIAAAAYPSKNAQEPGSMLIAYPANLTVNGSEKILLELFIATFSNGPTANLYKKFVDTKTRQVDLGAQSTYGFLNDDKGGPVLFGVSGISSIHLNEEKAALVRKMIIEELSRIAALPDTSRELKEFNERLRNNMTDAQRSLSKFISTPPKFGFRNTNSTWYDQLKELNKSPEFRKSLLFKPQLAEIDRQLKSGKNIWKDYIAKWQLTTAFPYVVYTKANPSLFDEMELERKQRATDEVARLKTKYNVSNDQEAIRKYQQEYNENSAALEKAESSQAANFISNPPLTLDDNLNYKQTTIGSGKVKMVTSTFNNMAGATTGIALKLNSIPQDKLVYLAVLPQLLTQTGYIKDGKGYTYEEMSQQLQKEILSLQSNYSTNIKTGRAELVVKGAGNNAAESQRAVEWMQTVLQSPNWTMANISRLRDLTDQYLSAIRRTMQGAEEQWVNDPADAYFRQDNPLLLATSSFLTRSHDLFRLRWLLKDAGDENTHKSIDGFLQSLASLSANREQLKVLLSGLQTGKVNGENASENIRSQIDAFNALPAGAKTLAIEASKDLEQMLIEIPDNSLAEDWSYLCNQIKMDLAQSPQKTLDELTAIRKGLLKTGNARMFLISSQTMQEKLTPAITKMLSRFENGTSPQATYTTARLLDERLKARTNGSTPVYVGLINPNSQTGVFLNSAPIATYADTSREQVLRYLAALLHGGGGKQSVYTKSTGAGLSYSTGVSASLASGRVRYYAERTPELPQTLRFVIDEIKRSPRDASMRNYIISLAMAPTRAASDYEVRGEAMAADLEDGLTPASIKAFRTALLKMRNDPKLLDEVYKRKDEVYSTIMPGYGTSPKSVTNGVYFVIGPEKQMAVYEAYLKSVDGQDTNLYRLYPRDYWMVPQKSVRSF
jgi:Zn-dependent M16 (insulinase) family peptidase